MTRSVLTTASATVINSNGCASAMASSTGPAPIKTNPAGSTAARAISIGIFLLALFALGGCSWLDDTPRAIVPLQETAAEQFAYALQYQANRKMDLIIDDAEYMKAREVVIQTFEKVHEYFPDDRLYTPQARLWSIEMRGALDTPRLKYSNKKIEALSRDTIEQLKQLAEDYPEFEFLQAKTMYDRAMCHKRIAEFEQAQQLFGQVRDQFIESKNKDIQNIAERSAYLYNRTYTQE